MIMRSKCQRLLRFFRIWMRQLSRPMLDQAPSSPELSREAIASHHCLKRLMLTTTPQPMCLQVRNASKIPEAQQELHQVKVENRSENQLLLQIDPLKISLADALWHLKCTEVKKRLLTQCMKWQRSKRWNLMKNVRKRYWSRQLTKKLALRPSETAKKSNCKPSRTKSTKTKLSSRLRKIARKSYKSKLVKESSSAQKKSRICPLYANNKTVDWSTRDQMMTTSLTLLHQLLPSPERPSTQKLSTNS